MTPRIEGLAEPQPKGPLMIRALLFLAFVATVLGANWAVSEFGLVPIGFGLMVPAGTYFAGLALALRDGVHEVGGPWLSVSAIVAGAALSYVVAGPALALASAAAFLLSELLDLAVYVPVRRWSWVAGVVASGVVGAAVDTWVFLNLAGFPVTDAAFVGQLVAKAVYVLPAALALVGATRKVVRNRGVARCAT